MRQEPRTAQLSFVVVRIQSGVVGAAAHGATAVDMVPRCRPDRVSTLVGAQTASVQAPAYLGTHRPIRPSDHASAAAELALVPRPGKGGQRHPSVACGSVARGPSKATLPLAGSDHSSALSHRSPLEPAISAGCHPQFASHGHNWTGLGDGNRTTERSWRYGSKNGVLSEKSRLVASR
jgi:hypothetical protein